MADDLTITVNGQAFSGWQDIAITRSLDQMADSFDLGYTDITGFETKPLAIFEGDAAIVKIDSETFITGYVDDSTRGYGIDNTEMRVSGRSKMGDPVDCAAEFKGGEWFNAKLIDIVTALLKPFGLTAVAATGIDLGSTFRKFALQDGETAGSAIDRACKMRGVLVTSSTTGDVILTRAGTTKTSTVLKYGENILSGRYSGSWKERFSDYTIKTQAYGDDENSGEAVASIKRTVKDTFITRHRPTIIMAENEDSAQELEKRASWERNVRAGRSRRLEYTVQGWRDDFGVFWKPNTLVRIDDAYLRLRDELLISSVTYNRSIAGTTTSLVLTPPTAYDVQPLPPKKPSRRALADQ